MAKSRGLLYLLASASSMVNALSPAQWRAQSIYQVLTDRFARTDGSTTATCDLNQYCGGTWRGIIDHLDYIQNMGFTAIWISPVVQNPIGSTPDGDSYHGYWANDAYKLNPKFGTSADLKALSSALHSRGMYLMVDVVPNHMGSFTSRANVDYSQLHPFNQKSFYHSPCQIDYNNDTSIKLCWVGDDKVSLPDLRTEDSIVANMWNTWIEQLVFNYSIDGLRVDTAQQVNQGFWAGFQSAAGGIHTLGEVFNGDPNYMCPYQNYLHGLMNFPMYYWITHAFQNTSGSISDLLNGIEQNKATCKDVTLLGSFIENHDIPRFPSLTSDTALIMNAIAFHMLADGIPILYEGQEQQFSGGRTPENREYVWKSAYTQSATQYQNIKKLNKIRSWAAKNSATTNYLQYNALAIYSDSHTIVMRKGATGNQIVSVFSNIGSSGATTTISVKGGDAGGSGFTAGQKVVEIFSCTTCTTDANGNLAVTVEKGAPLVFYPRNQLANSGICGC